MGLVGQRLKAWSLPVFLLGVFVFLYLSLFRLPFTPIFTGGDENLFLPNATRILDGETMYRDFFEFAAPGLTVANLGFFKLFGVRVWVPEVSLVLLGLGLTSLIVFISRKVLTGAAAFLPAVLFLTCAYGLMLDDTQHWYSTLAELGAVATVIERRTRWRIVAAGALCGIAAFFMQTQGAFVAMGLAIFLLWEGQRAGQGWGEISRRLGYLFATIVATVLFTNAYFVWKVGFHRFLYCTVGFLIESWSAGWDADSLYAAVFELRNLIHWNALFPLGVFLSIHTLLPLVYIWFWARYRREAPASEQGNRLMMLSIVGLFLFAGLAPAPTTFRLSTVTPPGLILLVWLIQGRRKFLRVLNVVLWVLAAAIAISFPLRTQNQPRKSLDLTRGRVALDSDYYDSFLWWSQHTHPGEYVFTAAGTEILFPLGLRNPAEVRYVTNTDFTRPEQVRNVIAALESKQVRFVLWDPAFDANTDLRSKEILAGTVRGYLRRVYRAVKTFLGGDYRPEGDHLRPLRDYLHSRYHVAKRFPGSLEVWERN